MGMMKLHVTTAWLRTTPCVWSYVSRSTTAPSGAVMVLAWNVKAAGSAPWTTLRHVAGERRAVGAGELAGTGGRLGERRRRRSGAHCQCRRHGESRNQDGGRFMSISLLWSNSAFCPEGVRSAHTSFTEEGTIWSWSSSLQKRHVVLDREPSAPILGSRWAQLPPIKVAAHGTHSRLPTEYLGQKGVSVVGILHPHL